MGGRPSSMSWWMGTLFVLGPLCFAVGSVPLYLDNIDPAVVAGTFVDSILFMSAICALIDCPGVVTALFPCPACR